MLYVVTLSFLFPESGRVTTEIGAVWSPEGPMKAMDMLRDRLKEQSCPLIEEGVYKVGKAVSVSQLMREIVCQEGVSHV